MVAENVAFDANKAVSVSTKVAKIMLFSIKVVNLVPKINNICDHYDDTPYRNFAY